MTVLLVLLCMVCASLRAGQLARSPVAVAAGEGAVVVAEVRLTSDVRIVGQPGRERATVPATTRWVEARGIRWRSASPVVLSGSGERMADLQGLTVGSVVRIVAIPALPDPGRPEAAVLRLRAAPELVSGPGWWLRQVNRTRAGLVSSMGWSSREQAGLTPSLVVGDTSGLLEETHEAFQATGLTHLTAVSGTNLTLLLATMLVVARAVGVRGRWLHLVGACGVVVFVVVCRSEPSVVRAAAMGLVGMAAVGAAGDARRGLRHLSAAILVLMLVDPWLARSWGFALSATASAGILWWGPPWRAKLLTWMPGWLAESLAIPLAAQLATQPLVTALSGSISTTGLLANVLTGPFVGPTTVLGMVAALLALVWPPLALPVGFMAGWSVQPVILIAHAGAGLPAATWPWPASGPALVVLGALTLLSGALAGSILERRWASLLLSLVLIAAMFRQPPPAGWPGQWDVAFCAVGQGDATVLNAGSGTAVLVDTGPEPGPVTRCLSSLGVHTVVLVVLTHYHADHIGGLSGVARSVRVQALLVNPHAEPAWARVEVASAMNALGVREGVAVPGSTIVMGRVSLEVLHAGRVGRSQEASAGESSAENDSSIVLLATVGETRVLLPGDVEPAGQQAVLASTGKSAPELRAQVIKMPHHGSSRQEEDFWRASGARLAVASAGERNVHGHPSGKALQLAQKLGMEVVRTNEGESFTVWVRGGHLHARAARLGG